MILRLAYWLLGRKPPPSDEDFAKALAEMEKTPVQGYRDPGEVAAYALVAEDGEEKKEFYSPLPGAKLKPEWRAPLGRSVSLPNGRWVAFLSDYGREWVVYGQDISPTYRYVPHERVIDALQRRGLLAKNDKQWGWAVLWALEDGPPR